MNILYLCHRIPFPPDKGDKIRSYHQIDDLARRHRLHVVTFVENDADERHVPALRERCATLSIAKRSRWGTMAKAALALLTGEAASVRCFHSAELERSVARILATERIDLVLVFSSAMAQYAIAWDQGPRVIDFVDVDSEKWSAYAERTRGPMALVYRLEAERLRRHDLAAARVFDRSIFVSHAEGDLFRRLGAEGTIDVIPMGVDLEAFRPGGAPDPESPNEIVFVGMMNYFPNVDAVSYFAHEVLPRVQESVPNARFTIIGRSPSAPVRALAKLPRVSVTGSVDDVRPYLRRAAIAVAPFRISRGMQSKVLEAMASGLPVVGSSLAFQGIPAGDAGGVEGADTAESFAAAVIRLLTNADLRRLRGSRARAYVEQHHRWSDQAAALETLLSDAAGARCSSANLV